MNDFVVGTPSDLEITMERTFDAPRDLVWAAHTQAEHLRHWWGRGNPLDVTIDFRVGGTWRCVEHADGEKHAFRGEYREIQPPERLVQTFEYEPWAGRVAVETYTFTEHDGRTTVSSTTRFLTREDRDAMITSGMEDGANESARALDKYLATLT